MVKALSDVDCFIAYFNNVIVHPMRVEQHLKDMLEIFERLWKANLTLKCSKCFLFKKCPIFGSHVVPQWD